MDGQEIIAWLKARRGELQTAIDVLETLEASRAGHVPATPAPETPIQRPQEPPRKPARRKPSPEVSIFTTDSCNAIEQAVNEINALINGNEGAKGFNL